ncbi:iron-sulfur cluster repair di-iron protein [Gorillibacterium timonense]|uniref:iron-sulfur cluster repair di-iron protein n=1 Tax=Gorillibacterium timonense TaxID=1689269 RepID=UPI00071D099A|nr:iron-sulfur cluster repair di-iron protein [Gorillibacterium timonense]
MNKTGFQPAQTLGEIVAAFPQAADVFKSLGLDFCCGGSKTLKEAAGSKGIEEAIVLAKLEEKHTDYSQFGQPAKDWRNAPYAELISEIVNTHHAYLLQELAPLEGYVAKIARVHGPAHPELIRVHELYRTMKAELEEHLVKEEEQLFPSILSYADSEDEADRAKAATLLKELESEHAGVGEILREIRELTTDYTLPKEACGTYRVSFERLKALESDMFDHIHLENNILFLRIAG